jgi:beta-N-acetylhexosaminidase
VDEEGGRVSRMPGDFVNIPTSQRIGEMNDARFSFQIGQSLGKQIKSLGINMNFAPVLDINSNPHNPIIGDRSFGPTAELVKEHGIQTMLGLQSEQVIPVIKHFPGHGDTAIDSHIDLPVVHKSLQELREFEFIPFMKAVDSGADVVMMAHILMTEIDPEYPASLSKTMVTDILRIELDFTGVIMTDDMTMGGIVDHYDIGEAAVQAVSAGSDMIMVAHGADSQREVFDSIKAGIKNQKITEQMIDERVFRILKLKDKYNINHDEIEFIDVGQINRGIEGVLKAQ